MVNQEPCFLPVGPGKLCNCWLLCLSVFLAFNVFLALALFFFSMGICASAHNCKGSLVNHSRYVLQSRVYLLCLAPAKHGYYPMTLWLYRCNFKRCVIMYAVKNRQSVKGEPLSAPPKKERESEKEIKRGGGVSHFSHHWSGISLLHCSKQSLPQVGEWLSFPDDLCETAIQFPQEQESIWLKRAFRLDGHRCEVVALVEGYVLILLAPLSQGCLCPYPCPCFSGDTW